MRRTHIDWRGPSGALALLSALVAILWRSGAFHAAPPGDAAAPGPALEPTLAVSEPLSPVAAENVRESSAMSNEATRPSVARDEVQRSPEASGPRKTHAQVNLVGQLTGEDFELERALVQVLADSNWSAPVRTADAAVTAKVSASGVITADVTGLFTGPALPSRLRVVAESATGCTAFVDVPLEIDACSVASPKLIQLGCTVELSCPRDVRVRITGAEPETPVELEVRAVSRPNGRGSARTRAASARFPAFAGRLCTFRTAQVGALVLIARVPGYKPALREFEIVDMRELDLGSVALEPGVSLSGVARSGGVPLNNRILEVLPIDDPRRFVDAPWLDEVGAIVIEDGVGGLAGGARARSDPNGHFEFNGLAPGRYFVRSWPARADEYQQPQIVRAPQSALELELASCAIELEFGETERTQRPRKGVMYELRMALPGESAAHAVELSSSEFSALRLVPGTRATLLIGDRSWELPPCSGDRPQTLPIVLDASGK
ncbi:MAG: hypothetical protein IT454_08045 [Planctomycetes bacterium]|nr:hypothetical protein [Planctomycetota bacterium]